jgi:hypothetical protein
MNAIQGTYGVQTEMNAHNRFQGECVDRFQKYNPFTLFSVLNLQENSRKFHSQNTIKILTCTPEKNK